MRGGPSLKGKGGLVGFRRSLKVQGSTFIFSNVKKVLVGFRKTSLNAKEVFRKPHFKADLQKNKAYFLIVNKKYQNLIRNPT